MPLNVFDIHRSVIDEYSSYVRSFFSIADERIREFVERELIEKRSLWPDPLIQLNPSYEASVSIDDLTRAGTLDSRCADIFRNSENQPIRLYKHQQDAIERAIRREPYVVTSGTGSGKTIAYFVPIFDAILRENPEESSVRAIVVYPMNALVNSQWKALETWAEAYEKRTGESFPVRFQKYTGQESRENKAKILQNPPHILLTNYVMLELMLVRPDEQRFIDRSGAKIQFLVIDELHTYRGRQGADVALLIRRLRERSKNPNLLCIGTSATMASGGTRAERRQSIASFASRLFGQTVPPENVVEETLRRAIPQSKTVTADELRHALAGPVPQANWNSFSSNPLSAWIEDTFGLDEEDGGVLRRRSPITISQGAEELENTTGIGKEICENRLREMLLVGSVVRQPGTELTFAFKLHQFVSQGGSVFATLEPSDSRALTLEGQFYAPARPEHLLFPLQFCRVCGQEYYVAQLRPESKKLFPFSGERNEIVEDDDEEVTIGYVMPDPEGQWTEDLSLLPEHWMDPNGRIKKTYRKHLPQRLHITPDGQVSENASMEALPCWFQPSPFMLCLSCGEAYSLFDKIDFRKLAKLSSEGRSTSTTLLSLASVAAMREAGVDTSAQKILSFTDNRQDASLQAGHFNDFVRVALLRSSLYRAMEKWAQLDFGNVADRVVEALNLELKDFAYKSSTTTELDPESSNAQRSRKTLRDVIEYRLYEDLRRGWRVVQPNLEQCGLLRMEYSGLNALVSREDIWQNMPLMSSLSSDQRTDILRTFMDELRRQRAIHADRLKPQHQESLRKYASEYLNETWGLDPDENLQPATSFVLPGYERAEWQHSLSRKRSILGRWLNKRLREALSEEPDDDQYDRLLKGIVGALIQFGLVAEVQERRYKQTIKSIRLRPSALIWKPGDGSPVLDPLRRYRVAADAYIETERKANVFFRDLYMKAASILSGMEGGAHTAQVKYGDRVDREDRFGKGDLACLFCSPTMELGIDISDLNAVHLRNVPPTPANYAQRSGRAGRANQPALVLTYCRFGSGHDQYFFRRRPEMVAGAVVPPRLDLSNEDLIRSHVHAIWLGHTGLEMKESILDVIDVIQDKYPLKPEAVEQISLSEDVIAECMESCQKVLDECGADLRDAPWFNEDWLRNMLLRAPSDFDGAFDRWRELFRIAWNQFTQAQQMKQQAVLKRGPEARKESGRADILEREARRQLDLLRCENIKFDESDFYPYRYLASEGFLPGYNFPALPIRAYIPRGDEGEYVTRPRLLALSEFGPYNIIYHEGAKYQSHKVFFSPRDPELRFTRAKICLLCDYVHDGESSTLDICEHCGGNMTGQSALLLMSLLDMPTAGTRRRDRITCDEEERLRYGYEVATHFRFAPLQGGGIQQRKASVLHPDGNALMEINYAPAALLWRINQRWRRSRDEGYRLDMIRGFWVGKSQERDNESNVLDSNAIRTNIRPYVRVTTNMLLIHPPDESLTVQFGSDSFLCSLEHALARGIQAAFQVEGREVGAELIGKGQQRGILFWEAAEGGLGVLRRLVDEQDAIARIARKALEILHFDPESGRDLSPDQCARACYECLLSYYNQREHPKLDRHAIVEFLIQLANSVTRPGGAGRNYDEQYEWLRGRTDTRSDLERDFLDLIYRTKRRLPDYAQQNLKDVLCCPDFYYEPNVCVFCDGAVHDEPQQQAEDDRVRRDLKERGYSVIAIRYDRDIDEQLRQNEDVLGESTR